MSKQDTQHHIVSKCPRAQLDGASVACSVRETTFFGVP